MSAAEKRVALVIGNGAYINAPPLNNPRNDANAMSEVLARLGFEIISGFDLGRDAMEDKVAEFEASIGAASAAMLFYAGHGLQVNEHNYLIPVDAEIRQETQLKRRAYSLDELLEIMARQARASLIFLDACRDNPFARSLLIGMGGEERKRYMARSGLAKVKVSQGSFIAFATAPGHVANDGRGSNSPFTEALVAHIEKPDVSVSDMMIEVRKDVLRVTGGKQEPWDQSSLRERFCFKVAGSAPEPPKEVARPPESPQFDERLLVSQWWERVKSGDDPTLLAEFLQRYPEGVFAPLARHKLAEMEWDRLKASQTGEEIEAFLKRWPGSGFETLAQARLAALRRPEKRTTSFFSQLGVRLRIVLARLAIAVTLLAVGVQGILWANRPTLDEFAFQTAERSDTVEAYTKYREDWPVGQYFSRAGQRIATLQSVVKAKAEASGKQDKETPQTSGKVKATVRAADGRDVEKWFTPGAGKQDGQNFQDCINRECVNSPVMVVAPAGEFVMGSPDDESDREPWQEGTESPPRKVAIKQPFAVGIYSVTRNEFAAFVADTSRRMEDGCVFRSGIEWKLDPAMSWSAPGFTQTGEHPVVCVNWDDAEAYADWLSKRTGKPYRLLSAAEREYVTRARTITPFWWGASVTTAQANYVGTTVIYKGGGEQSEYRQKTLPVKSFQSNPWGLYQVHGNVWEWVQDCWNDNYEGTPTDGSAWRAGNCSFRVLRGGSWDDLPRFLRAASRYRNFTVSRSNIYGFRLARTLNP